VYIPVAVVVVQVTNGTFVVVVPDIDVVGNRDDHVAVVGPALADVVAAAVVVATAVLVFAGVRCRTLVLLSKMQYNDYLYTSLNLEQ